MGLLVSLFFTLLFFFFGFVFGRDGALVWLFDWGERVLGVLWC